ncbi:MAG: hypothetical protein Q7J12_00780, partial [Syntrophales bacterium]|nr:hypothetical protein [Syntrophales bacterium]
IIIYFLPKVFPVILRVTERLWASKPSRSARPRYLPDGLFLILPIPAEGIQESLVFIRVKPLRVVAGRHLEN